MTPKRATAPVVILLLATGAACVGLRTRFRHDAPLAAGDSLWQLTCEATLSAKKSGATVRLAFPETTRHCRVFEHEMTNTKLTAEPRRAKYAGTDLVLTAPGAGPQKCTAQFRLHLSEEGQWPADRVEGRLTAKQRDKYLQEEKTIQVSDGVVTATLESIGQGLTSKDDLLEELFRYCSMSILPGAPQDAKAALTRSAASPLGHARAMVALCRAGKIPARLVTGFELKAAANARPHTWVEVLEGNRWEPYDPVYGFQREMPGRFVPVRRDGVALVRGGPDVADITAKYSIARIPPPPGIFDVSPRSPLQILDLTRLPAKLHKPLEIILLLPLGALVTAMFRTVIGLRTFGTFSPTLLALAFVFNNWQTGLVVFFSVVIIGLVSRTFLDRLKLLMVPRLGVILTLVVLAIVFGIAVQHYFAWVSTGQMVLLPMVILTMLVERFYVTTEEDSMRFALQLLAGTLVLGFIVYLLLNWERLGHMLLIYPELHLFTIAALVLLGRYTGYRLTELWRFRDLA